jgi:hypothetical protein
VRVKDADGQTCLTRDQFTEAVANQPAGATLQRQTDQLLFHPPTTMTATNAKASVVAVTATMNLNRTIACGAMNFAST